MLSLVKSRDGYFNLLVSEIQLGEPMLMPKVKLISDDGFRQQIELTHPTDPSKKFVIFHGYKSHNPANGIGKKIDCTDETVIRELWKQQLERHGEGVARE